MHLKWSTSKWHPFCPGGDELINQAGSCFPTSEHIEAKTKWLLFNRWHFQTHFLYEDFCILTQNLLKFIPSVHLEKKVSIGSGDCLVPNRKKKKNYLNQQWLRLLTPIWVIQPAGVYLCLWINKLWTLHSLAVNLFVMSNMNINGLCKGHGTKFHKISGDLYGYSEWYNLINNQLCEIINRQRILAENKSCIGGLVQEKCNSSALAMELHLFLH